MPIDDTIDRKRLTQHSRRLEFLSVMQAESPHVAPHDIALREAGALIHLAAALAAERLAEATDNNQAPDRDRMPL